jgi:ubiquinone/menaquinone biosynthesis C-methylase UbiE
MRDYREYLKLVGAQPGEKLLDIACGEGFLLEAARHVGLHPFGVEISPTALQLARRRVPGVPLVQSAGEALPFTDRFFDRITCLGSLEHFVDPAAGAREIARLLRDDGAALIVVPNRRFVGWLVLGRRGTEQRELSELLLDREEWTSLLEAAGLRVAAVSKEPWHTKPLASRARRLLLRWAWHLIPLRWTYQFAFLCRRATDGG